MSQSVLERALASPQINHEVQGVGLGPKIFRPRVGVNGMKPVETVEVLGEDVAGVFRPAPLAVGRGYVGQWDGVPI